MSRSLSGRPGAPGVAVAAPWLYRPDRRVAGAERRPLDEAVAVAEAELLALAQELRAAGRSDEAGILEAQALMARDETLLGPAAAAAERGAAPDVAIEVAGEEAAAALAALDDPLLAARAADVRDVASRIARAVRGESPPRLPGRSVAVAADLPPSVTAELQRELLAGIALEGGAPTAHAVILARGLGIPAVVGATGLLAALEGGPAGAMIGIDGGSGEVWLDPDEATLAELERRGRRSAADRAADVALGETPLATRDGHRVRLAANIGRPEDAAAAREAGADGIGLFRTEFIFMGRGRPPSVDEQARAYASVLAAFEADGAVVLRMADIGGDKEIPYLDVPPEANPFLGLRAIRLVDGHRRLLVDQLRAILRAGQMTGRQPAIMAPMVADAGDVALLEDLLEEALGQEAQDDVPQRPRVGIMIELPSAALLAQQLAARVDFFSIGTNDLTQYLLAADRTNPALAARQDPLHPAVLRAIASTVSGARAAGIGTAACGEMAGDPAGAMLLVGLGIDELSTDPGRFGELKRALAAATLAELQAVARGALELLSAGEVRRSLAPFVARARRSEAAA